MLEPILGLFADPSTNPHQAPLLFTCRAVEVLNLVHKSQVIRVEKNADCESPATRLGAVAGIRSDDNFYAKHMAGAYGGRLWRRTAVLIGQHMGNGTARRTLLIVGERNAEEAFLRHGKQLYVSRGGGLMVAIKNAHGRGAQHVIKWTVRPIDNATYDSVAVLRIPTLTGPR